jgi:SprT protein
LSQKNTKEILSRYFPIDAVNAISQLMEAHRIRLKVPAGRATRLGDFKPAVNGGLHQISVNGDLNIYAFLLVFAHELAHLLVHEQLGGKSDSLLRPRRIQPHGKEWKRQFGELIRLFVERGYFHPLLREPLNHYSLRVRASGIASEPVVRALRLFDDHAEEDGYILLEEMPHQGVFYSRSGRPFRKGALLRKRYKCLCLDNQRTYLFHPMASVRSAVDGSVKANKKRTAIFAGLSKF